MFLTYLSAFQEQLSKIFLEFFIAYIIEVFEYFCIMRHGEMRVVGLNPTNSASLLKTSFFVKKTVKSLCS